MTQNYLVGVVPKIIYKLKKQALALHYHRFLGEHPKHEGFIDLNDTS